MEKKFEFQKIDAPMDWLRIRWLYQKAFPASERKPFSIIMRMWKQRKSDVWVLKQGGKFAGFATTINAEKVVLLDYLAVEKHMRGRGVGSAAVREMMGEYASKGLLVEIESPFEPGKDQEARIRRKAFYERCGLTPMKVMAEVFGVRMELLMWNGSIDFAGYRAFYRDNYSAFAANHIVEAEYPNEDLK